MRKRIESGESVFKGETPQEILTELLEILEVPIESQVLVYSKTSAQNPKISPERPRSIYFSDEAYVGWVQNGNIELTSFDPKLGAIFYLMDLSKRDRHNQPFIGRNANCLTCHAGGPTRGPWSVGAAGAGSETSAGTGVGRPAAAARRPPRSSTGRAGSVANGPGRRRHPWPSRKGSESASAPSAQP